MNFIPQFSLAGFVTCFATLSLGLLVFFRNKNSRINRVFFFYSLAISQWSFFTALHSVVTLELLSLFSARAMHLGVALIPILFFHFCIEILGIYDKHKRKLLVGYLISGCFILMDLATPLIVMRVRPKLGYHYFMDGGLLYPLVIAFFAVYVVLGLSILFMAFRASTGNRRNQLKYLFYGSVLGYAFGPSCFLPVYDITIFPYPFGSYAITIYVGITALAIVKYHLLDIEVLIRRTAVFAGLSAFVLGTIVITSMVVQDVLGPAIGLSRIWTQLFSAVIIIALFDLIKKILIEITDRFLFQKKHDPLKILKAFSRSVLTELELDKIVIGTKEIIDNTIHPECFSIYLWDIVKGCYLTQGEAEVHSFGNDSKLVDLLHKSGELVSIEGDRSTTNHKKNHANLEDIKNELQPLKMVLALPLQHQEKLLGFMLLGKKKSDEEYSELDLEILTDLALEETIAVNNALASIELAKTRSHKHLADLADGFSHQINNRFYAIMTLVDTFIQNYPFELKALSKLPENQQLQKTKELLDRSISKFTEVHQNSELGGDIAKAILLQTRADKVPMEILDISVGIKLGLTIIRMKRADFDAIVDVIPRVSEGIPPTYNSRAVLQDIFWTSMDNSYLSIKERQAVEPHHKGVIEVIISYNTSTNYIRAELKDNGMGMYERQLQSVNGFTPFFTTRSTGDQKAGYGKGVYMIAHYVMVVLKGRLHYESERGKGTTLIMEFPVRRELPKKEEDAKQGEILKV